MLRSFANGVVPLTVAMLAGSLPTVGWAADAFHDVVEEVNPKLVKLFGFGGFRGLTHYGTGILISEDGYILTTASQMLDTSDVTVHLYDGRRMRASLVVIEPELDAAIIKLREDNKPIDEPLSFKLPFFDAVAASKRPSAQVGDWVIAFSNCFEIAMRDEPMSVQRGVIAAVTKMTGRRGVFDFPYTGDVYIIDAITNNPGSAGGALTDRKGQLLGIIGREIRNTQSNTWMNYAIPINAQVQVQDKDKTVTISMADFLERGIKGTYKPIQREKPISGPGGYHGIIFVPNVLERTPAYIEDVVPDSPAAKAGLRPDDLVSFVDGEPVVSIKSFKEYISRTRPGMTIRLEVRRGEALQPIELTLTDPPPKPMPLGNPSDTKPADSK